LELVVQGNDKGSRTTSKDVGTCSFEEGLRTFLCKNFLKSMNGRIVLDSLTRGQHHAAANGVDGIRNWNSISKSTEFTNSIIIIHMHSPKLAPVTTANPTAKLANRLLRHFMGNSGLNESYKPK
jgi:hypothetical protein